MPSHIVIRATDGQPFELQDVLVSDAKWKILAFAGDMRANIKEEQLSTPEEDRRKRRDMVVYCCRKIHSAIKELTGEQVSEVFEMVQIR